MFRRRSSRRTVRPVIQSVKRQIVVGPITQVPGNIQYTLTKGTDLLSVPVEQAEVPTGAIVKYIEVQVSQQHVGTTDTAFTVLSVQLVHSGQVAIDPYTTGGNEQRNQVMHTIVRCVSPLQNSNVMIKFKIPKRYQRIRNGDRWIMTVNNNIALEHLHFVFFKYYT